METTILITPDRKIKEIQEQFHLIFPFLKIEFLKKGFHLSQLIQRAQILPGDVRFGCSDTDDAAIVITPFMTVKELVTKCEEYFHISVQIYRKAGNIWLETTKTDNWTIKQQNENGSVDLF